jgi:hypothetical protein|tara:strand:- start:951 stop:4187 length:3237 start_codon:yes stop_codon:yes gene_type:complete
MPVEIPQIAFSGGAISPATFSRVDLAKFGSAAKTLRNFFVRAEGGASNRAGFKYAKEVKDSAVKARLIPFEFNEEQAYIIEAGNLYMRFYSDGGAVLESSTTISGATAANPVVVTDTSHPYTNGEEIYITGVVGMTELNGKYYKIANKATHTYELTDIDDTNINGSGYTAYSSAGTAAAVHTIVTTYVTADLAKIKFRQSNDTLYLTHTSYPPAKLVRTGAANWTLSDLEFEPEQGYPTDVNITVNTTGSEDDAYMVTAVADETAEESLVATVAISNIAASGATQANPCVITTATHSFTSNDKVYLRGFSGMTELNDQAYLITVVNATTFSLQTLAGVNVNSTGYGAYSSGSDFADSIGEAITGATAANPVVVTCTAHSFADGDEVHLSLIAGMIELNGRRFTIANKTTNSFELKGEDGTGHTAYSAGGVAEPTMIRVANSASTRDNTLTWSDTTGASSYNVYKEDNGLFGFIGSTDLLTFTDDNIAPDLDDTAPKWRQPFETTTNYPGAIGLHEQRSVFGNTTTDPLTTWLSQTSQFENMNVSSPTRDADAVTIRLVTGRGNEIRHFRSFQDRLFIFTSGAVWSLKPGGDVDAITPASKKLSIEEYLGSTDVPPLTIKTNLLVCSGQANLGFEVHSLGYKFETDAYAGSDLTVLARHLFQDRTINEWAYAERPFHLVACVRDDGKLAVLTYLQEHQVFAWCIWEAAGLDASFESVAVVPEGQIDKIYVIVKRTINGSTKRYIEHLHTRSFTVIEDAFFVDSGLTLDNPITISGATAANPCVITASGHGLSDGDAVRIRNVSGMTEMNEDKFIVVEKTTNTLELLDTDGSHNITAITEASPGVVTTISPHGFTTGDEVGFIGIGGMVELNGNGYTITVINTTTFSIGVDSSGFTTFTSGGKVYLNTNSSAFTAYKSGGELYAEVTSITGLDHLEGEAVIALADGNLVTGLTVSSGSITLATAASIVHVGKSYDGTIDSLPLDLLSSKVPTVSKKKIVKQVSVRVQDTRGLFIGPDSSSLEEYPSRSTERWGDPAATLTDLIRLPISDDWAREAGVTIKSEQGLPMTILSMMADTDVGD